MWWRKIKAWFRGEDLAVDHLISELTDINKRLLQYSDQKANEAIAEAVRMEQARQRQVAANAESQRASVIAGRVKQIYDVELN